MAKYLPVNRKVRLVLAGIELGAYFVATLLYGRRLLQNDARRRPGAQKQMSRLPWIKSLAVGLGITWLATGAVRAQLGAPAETTAPAGYVRVPGTNVLLLPPPGFGTAPGFAGLRKGDAALLVHEMRGSSYYANAASFGGQRVAAHGGNVLEDKELGVGGYPARLVASAPRPGWRAYQLAFGDSTFAAIVTTQYPAADTAAGAALRRALLTARYAAAPAADPFARVGFRLDNQASSFRFARAMGSQFVYARAGTAPDLPGNAPVVTVIPMPFNSSMTAADVAAGLLGTLRQYGLTDYMVQHATTTHPNDLETYEVEGYGKLRGQKVLVFQQVTVIGNTAVAMEGLAHDDYAATLADFKKLTHSIKKK